MGYSPWGPKEWDTAERLTHTHTHSGAGTLLLGTRPWPAPPPFSLLCAPRVSRTLAVLTKDPGQTNSD